MVGGDVIGIARKSESSLVHVQGRGTEKNQTLCIRLVEKRKSDGSPVEIKVGDAIWWQGCDAMWTPKAIRHSEDNSGCGKRWDIHLRRVGYSH